MSAYIDGKPSRNKLQFRIAALDYVNAQLKVMSDYGSAKILSPDEFDKLVSKIQAVGESLWTSSGGVITSDTL